MRNTIITSAVSAIVVVIAALALIRPSAPATTPTVKGAPDFSNSPYLLVNGVLKWYYTAPMKTATTSLCSFQAPLGTSTLDFASFHITTGTSTASLIDVATSTTNYSTTTANSLYLKGASVPANVTRANGWIGSGDQTAYIIYSSTSTPMYVNFLTEGAGLGGYTYNGTCSVVFNQL